MIVKHPLYSMAYSDFGVSPLGILYATVKVQKDISLPDVHKIVGNKFSPLDEVFLNVGILSEIEPVTQIIDSDENFDKYLVKWIPTLPTFTPFWITANLMTISLFVYIIILNKYKLYNFVINTINQIL